jgi:hypothetical protein
MSEGKVISGGQNDFKPFGEIVFTDSPDENGSAEQSAGKRYQRNTIAYRKGRVNQNTNRNDNECWSAGTPVTWEDDVQNAKTVTVKVPGSIDDMLVTRDPITKKIIEYHPVITFFNEVMAQMMRDNLRDIISNLEKETNAVKVWAYLEKKYLKGKGKKKATKNGKTNAGATKMAASKMRKPLKKSKVSKKGSLAKKK